MKEGGRRERKGEEEERGGEGESEGGWRRGGPPGHLVGVEVGIGGVPSDDDVLLT